SLSPDGARFAFHSNYRIHICRLDGAEQRELAAERGVIYFGSSWSPDGEWVLFQACDGRQDPAHDWSRIGIAGAAGKASGVRWLTAPATAWFGASYGEPGNPGGGSNQPQWAPGRPARVLFVRQISGSVTPWAYAAGRRDTDHFNRDYRPDAARGGTHLASVEVATGKESYLTPPRDGVWDFRPACSPDGRRVCFLRAPVGQAPELWVADARGGRPRALTRGVRGAGCEHPAWVR
ncbi:MAG: PD40 domain-containing protein, partial [Bryobacterales bacterium]|nr:PD40 domain-containing protein [Bryobacterales bacterium]